MLEVGSKAPDFALPDQNGKIHSLSDYAGKKAYKYGAETYQHELLLLHQHCIGYAVHSVEEQGY